MKKNKNRLPFSIGQSAFGRQAVGFTLIELLVVISIIGVLAGLSLASFSGAQKQARDTQRKNDLKQYQTLLENYASKSGGFYPRRNLSSGATMSVLCNDLDNLLGAITCPDDPKDGDNICDGNTCRYRYQTEICGMFLGQGCATKYVLWAALEQGQSSGSYWVVCSNGISGEIKSGIPPSGGDCPLK
jgi:prepilin-type N-terminal cleavage/methylation domain-containing protein